MDKYAIKRAKISIVWLIVFGLIFWGGYRLFVPGASCSDGVKNQNEEDVDCGGICAKCEKIEVQPLVVQNSGFTASGISGKYDFYALIKNPNNSFGGKNFTYEVSLKDAQGAVLATRRGNSFILPGEEKYIVETNIDAESPSLSSATIISADWIRFNDTYERPDIRVVNKEYNMISSGYEFSEAKGLVKNESPFDFGVITIRVILKDKEQNVIGLNSTRMGTVNTGEARDFRITWPNRFPGEVASMDAQVEVDIFDNLNFTKKYFKSEQILE